MKKKTISLILAVVMVTTLLLTGCKSEPAKPPVDDLVLDAMTIVLPAEATAVEQTAATELQTYVKRISGTQLEIITEGEELTTGAIYLGATEFAGTNAVTFPDNQFGEGWAIKAIGKDLVITGGEKRGTLYGVYHLLEDSLGVRWWNYWEEYAPMMDQSRVPGDYDDSGVPTLDFRDIHGGLPATRWENNVFCVRNRLNGDGANAPKEYGGEESFGKPAHVHTFNRYFGESDFRNHPEWFAYYDGGRIITGQLCLTNEELAMEFTNRVLRSIQDSFAAADFDGTNRPLIYDVSPNDIRQLCNCEACHASQKEHGDSGYLLQFVNKIAEGVAHYYPEVYIETLAYSIYVDAPLDDTKPADNVIIRLAPSDMDVLHGLDHFNNEKTLQHIEDWSKICAEGQLYLWDYVVFYGNTGIAPTVYKFADNFKIMADLGVNGYFGEQEDCIATDFWDMKFWVIAKLCEDPYQDEEALISDFLNGYYGNAAPYVRQYLDLVSEKANASSAYCYFGAQTISSRWVTVEDIVTADGLFKQAFEAAQGDETLLRRLRHARNALDRMIITNFEDYSEKAQEQGIAFDLDEKEVCQRLVDCLEEQIALRGEYDYTAGELLDIYSRKLEKLS